MYFCTTVCVRVRARVGSGGSGCNDGCCGPSGPDLSMMAAATSKTGNFRGEISGSQCLSIDLGEDIIAGAVWSEKNFTVSSLGDAKSTAISVTKDGNREVLDFLESPSEKVFDSLKGISFGSSAESKKGSTSDIVFPTRYLGQEKDSSVSSLYSLMKDPTTTFSKSQALRLPLPNSSIGETVSLHPEELVALQLQYWASKARAKQQAGDKNNSTKNKKKQKFEKGVTLVVPGYYGQRERNVAKLSAAMAGLELQHVYSRGLCATAAALLGSKATTIHSALKCCTSDQQNNKSVVVLFVHVNTHGVEVSLIECERPLEDLSDGNGGASRGGTNAMYYDRLVCLASGGCGGLLEGVSGMSVIKHQSDQHIHGNTACCGGKSHNHDHHGHNESKGIDKVDEKSSDYDSVVTALIARVVSQQLKLANLVSGDISLVLHSGRGSPQSLRKCFEKESRLARLASTIMVPVPDEDPAKGGAILTAAELDSSKQYIEVEEDHSILVHSLSIAEDVMSTSIGMLYVESEDMENSLGGDTNKVEGSIQCIYPAGTVIRKTDVGPVRKQVTMPTVEPKDFCDGTVSFFGSHNPSYQSPAYPKLLLVQLEPKRATPDCTDEAGVYHWRPVTDVGFPLLTDNGRSLLKAMRKFAKDGKDCKVEKYSFQKQALLSCKINFRVNESHGLLTLEHAQGHKVAEKVKAKSQVAKIVYTVGFICMLVLFYFAYGVYLDNENHRQDVEWLTNFYEKHSPKVSGYVAWDIFTRLFS